jgi:hypothetical protein
MIVVYILTDDVKSERVDVVRKIFSDKLFTVARISINPNISEFDEKNENEHNRESEIENYRVMKSLEDARLNHRNNNVIIVKDTSITHSSPERVAEMIEYINSSSQFDVLYLCKWLDRCDLYTDKERIMSTGSMVVRTQSPNGIQCIMFTPKGRDILLGKEKMKNGEYFKLHKGQDLGYSLNREILNANINAHCIVPNLIDFDPTLARANKEYNKSSSCSDPDIGKTTDTGTSTFWWILFLILLIILIIWGIYKLRNNYYN